MKKHVLVKNTFTNWLNMGLPQGVCVKKTVKGEETHHLSSKEKIVSILVSKEGHADSVLRCKRTYDNWFPWKRCNCKSTSYCQLHWQNLPYLLNDPWTFKVILTITQNLIICDFLLIVSVHFIGTWNNLMIKTWLSLLIILSWNQ